jgi:hypothetical protein
VSAGGDIAKTLRDWTLKENPTLSISRLNDKRGEVDNDTIS